MRAIFSGRTDSVVEIAGDTMRMIIAVAGVAVFLGASSCLSQAPARGALAHRFVGTWRLASFQGDSITRSLGASSNRSGVIYYDATGHMAVQIQQDRSRPSWPQSQLPTSQQAIDAVSTYTAYYGTYSVDEKARTVTHHREGALNLDLVDYVRRFEFDGNDRLTLTPVDRPGLRLVWERLK